MIGFGRIGAGYADDPVMARHYPYATHAQVLAAHPAFQWVGVTDRSPRARRLARERWGVPAFRDPAEMAADCAPDVAVLATPPGSRTEILDRLPSVRAVLVEKPLGRTPAEGRRFLEVCHRRGILVQVNFWRRADRVFRDLAAGGLQRRVGAPQAVFGLYGNGLLNNGTHMVDFIRMLLGEVRSVQALAGARPLRAGPIEGDVHVAFSMRLYSGLAVAMQPLAFEHYRENALDIWGEKARLFIGQEGLGLSLYPRESNRGMQGESEIASDRPRELRSTVGTALYHMYTNLAAALGGKQALWSSGPSALQTERVVGAIRASAHRRGETVVVE